MFTTLGEMTDADKLSNDSTDILGAIRQTSGFETGLIRKY